VDGWIHQNLQTDPVLMQRFFADFFALPFGKTWCGPIVGVINELIETSKGSHFGLSE
jgi:hypothetical protein